MRARLAALVFLGAAVGCFSFPSADEYAAGAGPGEAAGAGVADAAGDVDVADVAVPYRFTCPPDAFFCDDFEGNDAGGAFGYVTGTPAYSRSPVHSGLLALHANVVQGQDGAGGGVTVANTTERLTLDVWFYVTSPVPYEGYRMRLTHLLFGPVCDWQLSTQVWLESTGLFLGVDTYDKNNTACSPMQNTTLSLLDPSKLYQPTWHHLTLWTDNTTRTRSVRAQVDDMPEVGASVSSRDTGLPGSVNVGVGVICMQTGGGCFPYDQSRPFELRADDVSLAPTR